MGSDDFHCLFASDLERELGTLWSSEVETEVFFDTVEVITWLGSGSSFRIDNEAGLACCTEHFPRQRVGPRRLILGEPENQS